MRSIPLCLAVARIHGHLVVRPGSDVFHVYSGPLTPSGRWVPRAGRTVARCRTRRLLVLERVGSSLDLADRRWCARCAARLTSLMGRAAQPVGRDERLVFWGGVTLGDLVTAMTLAQSVDELSAVDSVLMAQFPGIPNTRPLDVDHPRRRRPGMRLTPEQAARLPLLQAMFDMHDQLNRRRRDLVAAARTAEEREANLRVREDEADARRQSAVSRRRAVARERAIERHLAGDYLTPWERALVDTA